MNTPSQRTQEIDYAKEFMNLAGTMFPDSKDDFDKEKLTSEPEFIRGVEWLRSFASRLCSAERERGWKKMEWRDKGINALFMIDEKIIARIVMWPKSYGYQAKDEFIVNVYLPNEALNSYKAFDTLSKAKLWVEQTVLSELNSLRSLKVEGNVSPWEIERITPDVK